MVHKCMMEAVQKSTSKQIHARQYTGANGKYPADREQEQNIMCREKKRNPKIDKKFVTHDVNDSARR